MAVRATKIRYLGEAAGQGASRALLKDLGDVALDFRDVPRSLVMKCPDGCGQMLSINLDRRSGKAWRLYGRGDQLTLFPSVWRDEGCEAHFILWRGQIMWCDSKSTVGWHDPELIARVRRLLEGAAPRSIDHVDLALQLDAIPWETLWACESLVRSGIARRQGQSAFFISAP